MLTSAIGLKNHYSIIKVAMAEGIKIINILKSDGFEEVFDEFKRAQANEVILIFPKNSQLAKDEAHFASLANAAQDSGKTVTIMTADEVVRNYSQKYGFKFLASPGKGLDQDDEPEPNQAEPLDDSLRSRDDDEEEEEKVDDDDLDKDDDMEKDKTELEEEEEELDKEPSEKDFKQEEWEETPSEGNLASLAMAKLKRPLKGSAKFQKLASEKKLENLESIWFKGGQKKEKSQPFAGIWSNVKIFSRSKKNPTKKNLTILTGAVVVLGLAFYFFLGNAQVVLKLKKQPVDIPMNVSASSNYSEINPGRNQIPGQLLTAQEEVSQDFPATGEKEVAQKARGEITVYNNYNSESQIFVATTRFQSANGLIFRTPRIITIPGAKLVSGKLVPGSVVVEVLADKPGPSYNIGPGKFTVPGLQGSPKFDGFYAESSNDFTGGIIGISKVITENDFNQAKETVTQKALAEASSKLKSRANNLKIIEPFDNVATSLKSTAEAEQATDGFSMKAMAKAKAIAFSEEDLLELARLSISKKQAMVFLKDTLQITFKNTKTNFEDGTISFTAEIKGEAVAAIDEEKIVEGLLGKKPADIKKYLLSIEEIESAKVSLSPFWVRSVPKTPKNIKVQVVY